MKTQARKKPRGIAAKKKASLSKKSAKFQLRAKKIFRESYAELAELKARLERLEKNFE
jgi:hypothetical protein